MVNFRWEELGEETSFYSSVIKNREGASQLLPARGFRKTYKSFYRKYINEVLIGIKSDEISPDSPNFSDFDQKIEKKLHKKSVQDYLNIITFFGDTNTDLIDLVSSEDINLLSDFEQKYNDHLVSFPFTLKFRSESYKSEQILESIRSTYFDFVSTLNTKNVLGYIPGYVSHRDIEKFIAIYEDNGTTIKSCNGDINFVPLLIDCKNSKPDNYKRVMSKLSQIKNQFLENGTYLFYYGFSVTSPRINKNKNEPTIANDFLLSYLGFDIIGNSIAITKPRGGSTNSNDYSAGVFNKDDFRYHFQKFSVKSEYDRYKSYNNLIQTEYLSSISLETQKKRETPLKELMQRPQAYEYIKSYD